MKLVILFTIILLFACESTGTDSKPIDAKEKIIGKWQTERENCDIFTTFYEDSTLLLERNERLIQGRYEFTQKQNKYTLNINYTHDDIQFSKGCSEDSENQFNFEGIQLIVNVTFNSDESQLQFTFSGSVTTLNKVE